LQERLAFVPSKVVIACDAGATAGFPIFGDRPPTMDSNEIVKLLLYLLPAVLVFITAFYLMKKFLDNQHRIKIIEARLQTRKDILPLKLQAYERLTLFLERVSPNNLLGRVYEQGMTVRAFHLDLLANIKQEFEHNITQQIYVSAQAWNIVRGAKEDVIRLINTSAATLDQQAKGAELNRKIFESILNEAEQPTQKAIDFLKQEVSTFY